MPKKKVQDTPALRPDNANNQHILGGIHPIESLLNNSPQKINKLCFQKNSGNRKLFELQKIAEGLNINTQQLPISSLNKLFSGKHQGIIAICHQRELDDWQKIKSQLNIALSQNLSPLLVLAASSEDPRNLGASIRSAHAFGVDVFLLPHKGSCGLTPIAAQTSAGAVDKMVICQLSKLEIQLKNLSQMGFQIVGLEENAPYSLHRVDMQKPTLIVVGGEDKGLPPHIKRCCTLRSHIPMQIDAHSLNVSVALSIALYEISRQRKFDTCQKAINNK